jgi:hypothetical protein
LVTNSFIIKDGSVIRFWEDRWLGNATLRKQYLALYYIARLYLEMPCSNVWQISICKLAMMNSLGIFMKMANFQ